jgi:SPP1 family predicted phage head-tail adaptor
MQAGLLRKRLQLQQRTTGQDAFGQQQLTWSTVATVWGQIESLSGNQLKKAQSIYNQVTHRVTARWQPTFSDVRQVGSFRILYGARIFDVGASINPDERNRTVELLCEEGLNDGQ